MRCGWPIPASPHKHVRAIELNYRKAAAFKETAPWLFGLLLEAGQVAAPERAQRAPSDGDRPQTRNRDPDPSLHRPARARSHGGDGSDGEAAGALPGGRRTAYLSGPSARGYLDESRFNEAGIRVAWMDYAGYPEYPQLWGPFAPRSRSWTCSSTPERTLRRNLGPIPTVVSPAAI